MRAPAALALLASAPALAQEGACPDGSTIGALAACEATALEAAEARLDDVLAEALAAAEGFDAQASAPAAGSAAQLRDAQEAWRAFRDAACAAEATPLYGGTGANLEFLECMHRETEARIAGLRHFIENAG